MSDFCAVVLENGVFLGETPLCHPDSSQLTPTHPKIARAQGGITPGLIGGELAIDLPSLGIDLSLVVWKIIIVPAQWIRF